MKGRLAVLILFLSLLATVIAASVLLGTARVGPSNCVTTSSQQIVRVGATGTMQVWKSEPEEVCP